MSFDPQEVAAEHARQEASDILKWAIRTRNYRTYQSILGVMIWALEVTKEPGEEQYVSGPK
jgi:hypothetical protein